MKKFLFVFYILSGLFAGCSNPAENTIDSNETMYKLDSVCNSHYGLEFNYRYDQSGNLTYRGLDGGSWFVEKEYDNNNRVKRAHIKHEYNLVKDYTYDTWGYIINEYTYEISDTDTTQFSKIEYTYDSLHCLTRELSMYYSKKHEWRNDYKIEKEYDQSKRLKCGIMFDWDNGTWIPSYKHLYTYNSMDSLESRIYGKYKSGKWHPEQKIKYAYNKEGRIIEEECKNWKEPVPFGANIAEDQHWKNSFKTEYEYDDSGNMIQLRYLNWTEDTWECYNYLENEYNEDNEKISSYWSRQSNNFSRYEYDHHLNSRQIIMPSPYYDGEYSPKSILHSSHPIRHIFSGFDTITFYYSPLGK